MRARSPKRAKEMREYIPLAKAYLAENEWCQFPLGCGQRSQVVHHTRGRFGKRLLDRKWWKASCHSHNQFAEDDTGVALACGWLVRIEGTGVTA